MSSREKLLKENPLTRLRFPSSKEFLENTTAHEQMEIWRHNHQILLNVIENHEIPFFGLHGTSAESAQSILAGGTTHLEMGTFYTKEKSEAFLYKLYDMALYCLSYARKRSKNTRGHLLVVDLEDDNGNNTTFPWEHLKRGRGYGYPSFDSQEEIRFFKDLDIPENTLFRTDGVVNPYNILSDIPLENFEQYLTDLNIPPTNQFGHYIMSDRFLAQQMVQKVLESFELSPSPKS